MSSILVLCLQAGRQASWLQIGLCLGFLHALFDDVVLTSFAMLLVFSPDIIQLTAAHLATP